MEQNDMFLKVEMIAYFAVNGLNLEKKEYANNTDANGIYLNKKMIVPDIQYFLFLTKDEISTLSDLPKSMKMVQDRSSYNEKFVSRAEIWKDDPEAQRIDELMNKEISHNQSDSES
jgi:hypothetical protein